MIHHNEERPEEGIVYALIFMFILLVVVGVGVYFLFLK